MILGDILIVCVHALHIPVILLSFATQQHRWKGAVLIS